MSGLGLGINMVPSDYITSQNIPGAMVLNIDTSLDAGTTISLPLRGTVNVLVYWGDGSASIHTTATDLSHTYAAEGKYTIQITGTLTQFGNSSTGWSAGNKMVTAVTSFGLLKLASLNGAFNDCDNLVSVPQTLPTAVTILQYCFYTCAKNIAGPEYWDVKNVTNFSSVFHGAVFNRDISGWNVGKGTTFQTMFAGNAAFNQDLSGWNMSKATTIGGMFSGGSSVNFNPGSWDLRACSSINYLFHNCSNFNYSLGTILLRTAGVTMDSTLVNNGMDAENYSKTLIGWANYISANGGPLNVALTATGRPYNSTVYGGTPYDNAVDARAYLVLATGSGGAGWTITGDSAV